MFRKIFPILAACLALWVSAPAGAQEILSDTGFTPYSLFGFGDLVRQGSTYNLSMGGIGIADRNVRYINFLNPAAVTAREPLSFMMDFGLESRNVMYEGNAATSMSPTAEGKLTSASNSFNMHHIVASLPIGDHSAFKLGLMPYSTVSYSFRADETSDELLSEVGDIRYVKGGGGGVYQAFLGAGVTLWKRLSLGADLDYYFGSIERYSKAYFTTQSSYRTINSGWDYNVSCFGGKLGLQYSQPLTNALGLVLGATYTIPGRLKGGEIRYAYGEASSVTDTITFKRMDISGYTIPSEIGAGFSLRYADQWMVGFDYIRQDWRGVEFEGAPGVDFTTGVSQSFRAGFEITPNRYDVRSGFGHFLQRLTYRAGAYREQSFFCLGGKPVVSTGVTLGMGIPVFRYYNSVNVGVDFGQRGSLGSGQIRERYFLFTISFNLHDLWFIPVLYQ
ncbi:MAG: hypothetical protein K6G79_05000 [Bacteroidales bacterium]|nr:hypothetical protein [Bacteroidales bacterium]